MLKRILIIIASLIAVYIVLVGIELYRFNNDTGKPPIILLDQDEINISSSIGRVDKSYYGLGYTIKYKYNIICEENSDVISVQILEGDFKLFNKILLATWIS